MRKLMIYSELERVEQTSADVFGGTFQVSETTDSDVFDRHAE